MADNSIFLLFSISFLNIPLEIRAYVPTGSFVICYEISPFPQTAIMLLRFYLLALLASARVS